MISYADDVKPSICSIYDFYLVIEACTLLEKASGVKLHRDLSAGKVKFLPLGRWRGYIKQNDIPFKFIKLSDHLDFVGVELQASYQSTVKANGDALQTRIRNTIGPWKMGRFMALLSRPHSLNCYAFSKVWFKCHTVNLRKLDVNFIISQAKSWLYRDLLLKPSEIALYRKSSDGGLDLLNVEIRAKALMTHTFLQTACNPLYIRNMYHEALFRFHVLRDDSLEDPGFTPYFNENFFKILRSYHENNIGDLHDITIRRWYSLLLDAECLKSGEDLIPLKCEIRFPNIKWPETWRLSRLTGLDGDLKSFLFTLLHGLLPTQEKLQKCEIDNSDGRCALCRSECDSLTHTFFLCSYNLEAGSNLVECGRALIPQLSMEDILFLRLGENLSREKELAVVSLIAIGLKFIWETRLEKKKVLLYKMRAELEARISLIRRTKFSSVGLLMEEMLFNT